MHSSHTFHIQPVDRPAFDLYDQPDHPPFVALRLAGIGALTLILSDTTEHAAWLRDLSATAAELAEIVEARSVAGAA